MFRSLRLSFLVAGMLATLAVGIPPSATAHRQQPTSGRDRVSAALPSAPPMFIQNVGQFDPGARFQVFGGDCTIWLAEDAIWVTVLEPHPSPRLPDHRLLSPLSAAERGERAGEWGEVRGVNLKLSFPGATPHPQLEPFGHLETSVNYFIGNDPQKWRTNVPVGAGVRYVDLYPGVDLEITGESGLLVPRLVAHPGADLNVVHLRIEGADGIAFSGSGEGRGGGLRLSTAVGEFTSPFLSVVAPDGTPPWTWPASSQP